MAYPVKEPFSLNALSVESDRNQLSWYPEKKSKKNGQFCSVIASFPWLVDWLCFIYGGQLLDSLQKGPYIPSLMTGSEQNFQSHMFQARINTGTHKKKLVS